MDFKILTQSSIYRYSVGRRVVSPRQTQNQRHPWFPGFSLKLEKTNVGCQSLPGGWRADCELKWSIFRRQPTPLCKTDVPSRIQYNVCKLAISLKLCKFILESSFTVIFHLARQGCNLIVIQHRIVDNLFLGPPDNQSNAIVNGFQPRNCRQMTPQQKDTNPWHPNLRKIKLRF